jgi:hypothetical protein
MIVISIDPGAKTGVALALMNMDSSHVTLTKKLLATSDDPYTVVGYARHHVGTAVIIERRATNPSSKDGTEPYEIIFQGLRHYGWQAQPGFGLQANQIVQVSPGQWKPFMQAQNLPLKRGDWHATTPHERDALNMLHYVAYLNNIDKEITYVRSR